MLKVQNLTSKDVLELALKYNENKDEKIFATLLAKFDKLLLHVIYKYQVSHQYLYREEMQELYHIAILGLAKAIRNMKASTKLEKIPVSVASYAMAELKQAYAPQIKDLRSKKRMMDENPIASIWNSSSVKSIKQIDASSDIKGILDCVHIEALDKELLERHALKGVTYAVLAKENGKATSWVQNRIARVMKRLIACRKGLLGCNDCGWRKM